MPFEKLLREMIKDELERVIGPLATTVEQLQRTGNLASQLASLLGIGAKRGPGRPRKVAGATSIELGSRGRSGKRTRPMVLDVDGPGGASRACAVIDCGKPSLSKGYCSSHYQKRRMLTATKRLPADWLDNAQPDSVKDLVLPRGRAGARSEAKK